MTRSAVHVRRPTVAGTFYPRRPNALADAIDASFAASVAAPDPDVPPKALIVPHAGYPYSGPVAASAYRLLIPWRHQITRVVLVGPSHRVPVRGLAVSGAARWETPLGTVPIDTEGRHVVAEVDGVDVDDAAHAAEHSLEVQVPFLQTVLADFALLPIVVGLAEPDLVATILEAVWGGPETLVVVSTDLSHYETYASAQAHDAATVAAILAAEPGRIGPRDACGSGGLRGLLQIVATRSMTIEELDVRNSGDTAGDRDQVVGYAAFAVR